MSAVSIKQTKVERSAKRKTDLSKSPARSNHKTKATLSYSPVAGENRQTSDFLLPAKK